MQQFFARCLTLFAHFQPRRRRVRIRPMEIRAFLMSMWYQLCSRKQGPAYGWLLVRVLLRYPHMVAHAIRLAIMGYHFEKITQHQVTMDDFKQYLAAELAAFQHTVARCVDTQSHRLGEVGARAYDLVAQVHQQYDVLHAECRDRVHKALEGFQHAVFTHYLEAELHVFQATVARWAHAQRDRVGAAHRYVHHLLTRMQAHAEHLAQDGHAPTDGALQAFRRAVQGHLEHYSTAVRALPSVQDAREAQGVPDVTGR